MTATMLRSWLRIGPAEDASHEHEAGAYVVNVLEGTPTTPYDEWIPILKGDDDEGVSADLEALERVAGVVRSARERGRRVYLHCGQGIERSPLAAAWVLWKLGECSSFDEAYREVKRLNPATQDRAVWIPWRARNP